MPGHRINGIEEESRAVPRHNHKYERAGVREYWIVDPKYRTVMVHYFEDEEYTPRKYEFDSQIPVSISGGKCIIDFSLVGKRPFRPF